MEKSNAVICPLVQTNNTDNHDITGHLFIESCIKYHDNPHPR